MIKISPERYEQFKITAQEFANKTAPAYKLLYEDISPQEIYKRLSRLLDSILSNPDASDVCEYDRVCKYNPDCENRMPCNLAQDLCPFTTNWACNGGLYVEIKGYEEGDPDILFGMQFEEMARTPEEKAEGDKLAQAIYDAMTLGDGGFSQEEIQRLKQFKGKENKPELPQSSAS